MKKENWNQITTSRRLGTKKKSGKKGSIARNYPKEWTSWAQSLCAKIRRKITWGNLAPRKMRPQSRQGYVLKKSVSKFLEPSQKPRVFFFRHFFRIWQIMWRTIVESPNFNTSSIRDKWHCWKSCKAKERRNLSSIAAIRIGWKMVRYFHGSYTFLRNVTDLLSDGKTPNERCFGQPIKGPIIPFGSLVEYHPITAKDQSRIHQFGKKVLPGLFLGYALCTRGEFGNVTYCDCRPWGVGNDGRIGNLLEKTQCERGDIS